MHTSLQLSLFPTSDEWPRPAPARLWATDMVVLWSLTFLPGGSVNSREVELNFESQSGIVCLARATLPSVPDWRTRKSFVETNERAASGWWDTTKFGLVGSSYEHPLALSLAPSLSLSTPPSCRGNFLPRKLEDTRHETKAIFACSMRRKGQIISMVQVNVARCLITLVQ